MSKFFRNFFAKHLWILFFIGIFIGAFLFISGYKFMQYTSTDTYCMSCHIHTYADNTWKKSTHFTNSSGVQTHCIDCHLPPTGTFKHFWTKGRIGLKHLWSYYTKDSSDFNWEKRRHLEYATNIVYNESCIKCHSNLFPKTISSEGALAHLYYIENEKKINLQCINCHLDVGHHIPNYTNKQNPSIVTDNKQIDPQKFYKTSQTINLFENFIEQIPHSNISFKMIAIGGGTFLMGNRDNEPYMDNNESPLREVTISPFFISETEITWNEYLAFYKATKSEGRINPQKIIEQNVKANNVDAISGPTPPYGQPDQGWGYGDNPAVGMTHYAAQIYCKWLSQITGKKYRLPTEAEWEYAARAGTQTAYFFEGSPKEYTNERFWNKLFGTDKTIISNYIVYKNNSEGRPHNAKLVQSNTFGLKNTLGNIMEYCSDWYSSEAYKQTAYKVTNPKGPNEGTEHVVRGGFFNSDAKDLRCAARDFTRSTEWLKTDPQSPKSIWWLSDCNKVGFRVVCEPDSCLITR